MVLVHMHGHTHASTEEPVRWSLTAYFGNINYFAVVILTEVPIYTGITGVSYLLDCLYYAHPNKG